MPRPTRSTAAVEARKMMTLPPVHATGAASRRAGGAVGCGREGRERAGPPRTRSERAAEAAADAQAHAAPSAWHGEVRSPERTTERRQLRAVERTERPSASTRRGRGAHAARGLHGRALTERRSRAYRHRGRGVQHSRRRSPSRCRSRSRRPRLCARARDTHAQRPRAVERTPVSRPRTAHDCGARTRRHGAQRPCVVCARTTTRARSSCPGRALAHLSPRPAR